MTVGSALYLVVQMRLPRMTTAWRARLIILGDKIAAEHRPLTEQLKCVRGDVSRRRTFCRAPVLAESCRRLAERRKAGEGLRGRLKIHGNPDKTLRIRASDQRRHARGST